MTANAAAAQSSPEQGTMAASTSGMSQFLVVTARDVTASSHCVLTYTRNAGTTESVTWSFACPVGTIIKVDTLLVSEAVAQHAPSAVIPYKPDSPTFAIDLHRAIHSVAAKTRAAIRQAAGVTGPSLNTGCGQNGQLVSAWVPSYATNTGLYAYANYYHSQDCKGVYVEKTAIQQYYGPSNSNFWSEEYDTAGNIDVSLFCRTIPVNSYTTYTVDENTTAGSHWINGTANGQFGGGCPVFPETYNEDMGAMN